MKEIDAKAKKRVRETTCKVLSSKADSNGATGTERRKGEERSKKKSREKGRRDKGKRLKASRTRQVEREKLTKKLEEILEGDENVTIIENMRKS